MTEVGNLGAGNRGESYHSSRLWIALVVIVIAVALLWRFSAGQLIETTAGRADDEVLLVLPALSAGISARERQLKTRVQAFPGDIASVAILAQLYIERSRSESDPRYLGYAQQLLDPWWDEAIPPSRIQRLRAILLQGQHRFKAAIADLNVLLQRDPQDAQSLLTRATVHQVLGNYRVAMADCLRLAGYAPLHGISCTGSILSLTGRAASAQALMTRIELQLANETAATRQWVLTLRGEIAERENQLEQAERYYRLALQEPLRGAYLLRVYSQFLLRRGQASDVLTLLLDEIHDDTLLLHAAIAAKRVDDKGLLQRYTNLIETRLRNAKLRGSTDHYYLTGRYALEIENLPDKALQYAKSNWLQSKEARDTELLAAAAVTAEDKTALKEIERWMSSQNAVLAHVAAMLRVYGDDA
jgi:tetratricopeptide (TPR) repeat protein